MNIAIYLPNLDDIWIKDSHLDGLYHKLASYPGSSHARFSAWEEPGYEATISISVVLSYTKLDDSQF